jgi:hypothetical protein
VGGSNFYHRRYLRPLSAVRRPPSAICHLPSAVCCPPLQLNLTFVIVARYCLTIPSPYPSNAIVHHLHLQSPSSISAVKWPMLIVGGVIVLLQSIADASIPIIFEFDAQCLCNLAHASAIAGHVVVIVIVIVVIVVVIVDFDSLLKA